MSNLVILKWRLFEYKAEFAKELLLFRSEIGIFDIFSKRQFSEAVDQMCSVKKVFLEISQNSQ